MQVFYIIGALAAIGAGAVYVKREAANNSPMGDATYVKTDELYFPADLMPAATGEKWKEAGNAWGYRDFFQTSPALYQGPDNSNSIYQQTLASLFGGGTPTTPTTPPTVSGPRTGGYDPIRATGGTRGMVDSTLGTLTPKPPVTPVTPRGFGPGETNRTK